MARIRLEAAADLVQQYVYEKDPIRAVTELIWNALDADAHNVAVTIERSPAEAPERITVVDDGHGMTPERVTEAFGRMSGSSGQRRSVRRSNVLCTAVPVAAGCGSSP